SIGDADTDAKKRVLFEKVRAGQVRVLIGSTTKMGTGTNVQKRLIALHHLDAPWKPAEVEQREGRILRQGNENEEVAVYRYVTEGSFDAYMWQALETKARFITHNVVESVMWHWGATVPFCQTLHRLSTT
ncbi:MAG TPA: helicase-related protein, partial [Chloroflexota bacterium]|nr:helicase-related protein [Chloroflexota bacterium]